MCRIKKNAFCIMDSHTWIKDFHHKHSVEDNTFFECLSSNYHSRYTSLNQFRCVVHEITFWCFHFIASKMKVCSITIIKCWSASIKWHTFIIIQNVYICEWYFHYIFPLSSTLIRISHEGHVLSNGSLDRQPPCSVLMIRWINNESVGLRMHF